MNLKQTKILKLILTYLSYNIIKNQWTICIYIYLVYKVTRNQVTQCMWWVGCLIAYDLCWPHFRKNDYLFSLSLPISLFLSPLLSPYEVGTYELMGFPQYAAKLASLKASATVCVKWNSQHRYINILNVIYKSN